MNGAGKLVCLVIVCAMVFVGFPSVKGEATGILVPELRNRDGSAVYAYPVAMAEGNKTGIERNGTGSVGSQPSAASATLTTDSWWNQYHSDFYKDGYANTYLQNSSSNSVMMSLGYGQKTSGSPVVTSQIAVLQNHNNAYGYNFDFGGSSTPVWTITNHETNFSTASDGTYLWDIQLYIDENNLRWGCINKYQVSNGALITGGPCWLLSVVDHFADIVYTPIGPPPTLSEQKVYVLVDYNGKYGSPAPATLYAFEAQTLTLRWYRSLDTYITQTSPVILQRNYEPREVMLGDDNGKFYVIREDSGVITASYQTYCAKIQYAASIDRNYWGYVYVVTSRGDLYKFNKNNFNSISMVWVQRFIPGVEFTFTAPVNTGDWVFVKRITTSSGYNYDTVSMFKKDGSVNYTSGSVTAKEYNSGNVIAPSIAVTNNMVFSPFVSKSGSNYQPAILFLGYHSSGNFFSETYYTCQNSPTSTSQVFAVDSSPAMIYYQSANKWLLYYTWYYNNGLGNAEACKTQLA